MPMCKPGSLVQTTGPKKCSAGSMHVTPLNPSPGVRIQKSIKREKQIKKKPQANTPALKTDALYPSWLLVQPLRLATHGNSPVYEGSLVRLAGPQRMESTGWLLAREGPNDKTEIRLNPPAIRDYFIYRSGQGALLWIYSERLKVPRAEGTPRRNWYLHGFFA